MKKITGAGPIFFAIAIAGFGIIQLVTQNFLSVLLPFPLTMPARLFWVYATSIFLLVAAMGMLLKKRRPVAAFATGILFFVFFIFLHLPTLFLNLHDPTEWAVAFETLAISSGAFLIANLFWNHISDTPKWNKTIGIMAIISRYLFALCLVIFGIQHFMYAGFIVTLIPYWIPAPEFWGYVVRLGFLLAAVSLAINFKVRLAAILAGSMFLLWVLLLHVPLAIEKLTIGTEWTNLCIALALCGIAFSIAKRYEKNYKI